MVTERRRAVRVAVTLAALLAVGAAVAAGIADVVVIRPVADPPEPASTIAAWGARILLLLAAAWLVIGMLSARTRLIRRPGAAAARASWVAATRPWRARESTLGMLPLDRWLMIIVPGALLVATRALQTMLVGWAHVVVVLGEWLVFAVVVRIVVGRRSPWPVIAAVGGVVMLRCAVALAALSFTGPDFWSDPLRRGVYITLVVALFVWAFVAAGGALAVQLGARRATGAVLAALGAAVALPAMIVAVIGLEQSLPVWNHELGLLPWGLSRTLGVTVALDVPSGAAWIAAALGALVAVVGVLLALPVRRR